MPDCRRGFTLIEVLIVVTIIAVLAAIAIPRFAEYRLRGYNASAMTDCRNARSAEEAFFTEWRAYASSGAGALPGAAQVLTATANNTGPIAANSIDGASIPGQAIAAPGFALGISNNVALVVHTSAQGGSFSLVGKNTFGDRCFGLDSDTPAMFWINGAAGAQLTAASVPNASAGVTDYAPNVAGAGVCSGNPAGSGQTSWVIL